MGGVGEHTHPPAHPSHRARCWNKQPPGCSTAPTLRGPTHPRWSAWVMHWWHWLSWQISRGSSSKGGVCHGGNSSRQPCWSGVRWMRAMAGRWPSTATIRKQRCVGRHWFYSTAQSVRACPSPLSPPPMASPPLPPACSPGHAVLPRTPTLGLPSCPPCPLPRWVLLRPMQSWPSWHSGWGTQRQRSSTGLAACRPSRRPCRTPYRYKP